MKFIEKKERIKEHSTVRYPAIIVEFEGGDIYFYKIEDMGDYIVEINSYNDFRVFPFQCNYGTWEKFIEEQVTKGDCCYTIIEEFLEDSDFEISIERV